MAGAVESWRTKRSIADVWPVLISAESWVVDHQGRPNPTVVEFVDYQCPSCRRIAEEVSKVSESRGVNIVVRHLPLDIHPQAWQASLAAVCAEEFGVFQQAHANLLTDDDWMDADEWLGWAASLGIRDLQAFESCVDDDSTSRRVEQDIRLAESIGVRGTPTFVTEMGVFAGERGLAAAIGESSAAAEQDVVARLSATALFDSGDHPNAAVSEIGLLSKAKILSEERIVLLDGRTLLFINPWTGELWTAGGRGGGPGEFAGSGGELFLHRGQDGLTVWDLNNDQRLTTFSDSGELLHTMRVNVSGFDHPIAIARLFAVFEDGSLAFVDGGPPLGPVSDTERPLEYLVEVSVDGDRRKIVEFPGKDVGDVLFPHFTFVAVHDDRVAVADTDSDEVEVVDLSGTLVYRIPMPGERVTVSEEDLEAALAEAQADRIRSEEETLAYMRHLGRPTEGFTFQVPQEQDYRHNEIAPPIDAIRFDADGRLWIRRYLMPGDDLKRWTVWDDGRKSFSLAMGANERWLDARGSLVLLRVRNSLGEDRAVVRELIIG